MAAATSDIRSVGDRPRVLIQRLAAEHDYVLSCEPTLGQSDSVALATSGGASATLSIKGRASHAGVSPELGRNALIELAHQLLQANELGKPLVVDDKGTRGGTDSAFAALSGRPVLESLGLRGLGFYSSDEEYIQLDSTESRLYLLSRLIVELSTAK